VLHQPDELVDSDGLRDALEVELKAMVAGTDDPRVRRLVGALRYALLILVHGYQVDARAIQDAVPGWCQGSVYRTAVETIMKRVRGESPADL
jgi:hypothetical protein